MTLLCLDIGNRLSVLGVWDDGDDGDDGPVLRGRWTISSDVARTADEWYLSVHGFVSASGLDDEDVVAVSMCCTVPSIGGEMRTMLDRYFGHAPVWVVGPGVRTGVAIHTDNPREVGTDRIVNALAATQLYGGPVIIVDLNGTATCVDAIDEQGRYLGGAIAPGVEVSLEALARRGAQLRSVEVAEPRGVIGKNTVEALQSGAVYGFAGLVDALVDQMIDAIDADDVTVVATGAYTDTVIEHCQTVTVREENLTMIGLRLVHEKNRDAPAP